MFELGKQDLEISDVFGAGAARHGDIQPSLSWDSTVWRYWTGLELGQHGTEILNRA